ncbi:MAG: TonB-dependent receptor [Pseudomonadota bacterium]
MRCYPKVRITDVIGLRFFLIPLMIFLFLVQSGSVAAASGQKPPVDFTVMSLEELLNVDVVSASKKMQKLSETDAAVFVISQDDLKRSGVTTIPDALRMVPGLQVARIDANKWAITARGFNDRFANKLLVLIDGRSVYTPLFSGVFWDIQDTMMEDIERIEVIRGPGATIWGANAVNGVINIITKKAKDTQGTLITAGTGTEERGFGAVRFGGNAGPDTHYRLYAKYFDRDGGEDFTGSNGGDAWNSYRSGFRIDWGSELTLQGGLFSTDSGNKTVWPILTPPYTQIENDNNGANGGHLLGRWEHRVSEVSRVSLQFYYDRAAVDLFKAETAVDTFDVEFNHQYQLTAHNEIMWGLGYRFTADEISFINNWSISLGEKTQEDQLFSGFLQNTTHWIEDKLRLTVGSKFEHNEYTGVEIQPSIRLLWAPESLYSLWVSAARAVRTPSRAESSFQYNSVIPPGAFLPFFPGPGLSRVIGSDELDAEDLYAFELGYRMHPTEKISIDIATFYNIYKNLRFQETQRPYLDMSTGNPLMIVQTRLNNGQEGDAFGAELALDWFLSPDWKLRAAYTYLHLQVDNRALDGSKREEKTSPSNQLSLRSSFNLPGRISLDAWARYVDSLEMAGVGSYLTADVRLGWQLTDHLELSITGRNLLEPSHPEYGPENPVTLLTETERSVYGKILWHF